MFTKNFLFSCFYPYLDRNQQLKPKGKADHKSTRKHLRLSNIFSRGDRKPVGPGMFVPFNVKLFNVCNRFISFNIKVANSFFYFLFFQIVTKVFCF